MAKNLIGMMGLDLYLSSLKVCELEAMDHTMDFKNVPKMPLLSWDIYSGHYINRLKELNRAQDILKIKGLARKLGWNYNINEIFNNEQFEAILVTDRDQKIIWVNDGFTEMTGYSKKEALYQTPKFLQGPKSSSEAKTRIRQKLSAKEPFTEVIINYKKNKEPYTCEVKIFPLYNEKTTHYIALEKRVI